jgi:sugar phosphate isomerase/epimerase
MNDPRLSRRGLIGAGAGLAASATVLGARTLGADAAETRAVGDGDVVPLLPIDRIGLQLYSVRSAVDAEGFDKVLGKLADIGFKYVEFAGYTQGTGDITVKQLKALLDKYGLKAVGSHVSPSDDASMTKILDEAEALGIPYVGNSLVIPKGPPTTDGWKGAAEDANHYGEMAAKRGIKYYLHNHFQEWAPCVDDPSKCGHDVFLEVCDPRFAFLELDIFWSYVGSAQNNNRFDPLKDYALKHRDRYLLFHVKDGVYDDKPAGTITDVGQGKIDFQAFFTELFKQSPDEASKHIYLWENDNAGDHPRGPLASAQSSYVNMRYALTKAAGASSPVTTPIAECTTTSGMTAGLTSTRFRRTKSGRRVLRLKLKLSDGAQVSARLTRGGKTLAKANKKLGKGTPVLNLPVPQRTAKGPAALALDITNGGTGLTVRRIVKVPAR